MKYFTNEQASRGFTLIELLTVIAVIGILAGILVPVVGGARFTAQKANARAEYANIAAALSAFHMDYGYYPMSHSNSNVSSDGVISFVTGTGTDDVDLVALLNGTNTTLNPRGKQYMQFSESNLTGDDFPSTQQDKYIDPFGNTEIVIVIAPNGDFAEGDYSAARHAIEHQGKNYTFSKKKSDLPKGKIGKFLIFGVAKTTRSGNSTKVEFVTYPALTTSESTVTQ